MTLVFVSSLGFMTEGDTLCLDLNVPNSFRLDISHAYLGACAKENFHILNCPYPNSAFHYPFNINMSGPFPPYALFVLSESIDADVRAYHIIHALIYVIF